jgi:enterobactin synthetase component D / holo-[acyl-carrier protein] synthase
MDGGDGVAWLELAAAAAWCPAGALVRVAGDAPAPSLAVVDPGEALARLHPDERSAGAALPIARRRDWAAGRLALRAALEQAGYGDHAAISADERGAPRLPAGWGGSISHKRGLAIAIAQRDDAWRLGVDLELDAPSRVSIEGRVLTAGERDALARLGLDADAHGRAVMLRFAIKEAIYKAIDPYVRRYVGFQEVELDGLDPDAGADAGTATIASRLGLTVEAGWRRWDGCVVAIARAAPR